MRISAMNTVVWTTLITAVATLSGSLGTVLIKGHYDERAQDRRAAENRVADREAQQRQAYGDLVTTARLALRNFRQLRLAYIADTPDIPAVNEVFSQTVSLASDMYKAAALSELVGSPAGRKHARVVHDKAKACADLYQARELFLAAAPDRIPGRRYGAIIPGGVAKAVPFDAEKANILCDELAAAIDEFIEVANTELGK